MRAAALTVVLAISLFSGTQAQEPPAKKTPHHELKLEVKVVRVDVLVTRKGVPVLGLAKGDFTIYEDSVEQEIQDLAGEPVPLSLVLVIDQSGSTKPFFKKAKSTLINALSLLSLKDEVALVGFDHELRIYTKEFTADFDAFADLLSRRVKNTKGGTDLGVGLAFAIEMLRETLPSRRRVVIIISDNEENVMPRPKFNAAYIYRAAAQNHVTVSSVRVGKPIPAGSIFQDHSKPGIVFINTIVDKTGGEVIDARNKDPIKALARAIDKLRNTYSLYYIPADKEKTDLRKIKVELKENPRSRWPPFTKKYKVVARKEYYY